MKANSKKADPATREFLRAVERLLHWAKRAEKARDQLLKEREDKIVGRDTGVLPCK